MGAFERVALFLSRLLTVLTVVVARCLFMVWRMPDCSNLIVINPYRRSTGVYSRVHTLIAGSFHAILQNRLANMIRKGISRASTVPKQPRIAY